jgi:hypothetical protein
VPGDRTSPWLTVITVSLKADSALDETCTSVDAQSDDGLHHLIVLGDPVEAPPPDPPRGTRTVVFQEPAGIYSAMNMGIDLAEGTLVHFLNAGDTYASTNVLPRVEAAYRATQFQWAFGRLLVVRHPGDPGRQRGRTLNEMVAHGFRGSYFPEHPTVFARRDLLKRLGGFDTSYRFAADYRLLLELAASTPGVDLGFDVSRYSLGGVSDAHWVRSVLECRRARMEYLQPKGLAAAQEFGRTLIELSNQLARRIARPLLGLKPHSTMWSTP